jgi:hypothetical protein
MTLSQNTKVLVQIIWYLELEHRYPIIVISFSLQDNIKQGQKER